MRKLLICSVALILAMTMFTSCNLIREEEPNENVATVDKVENLEAEKSYEFDLNFNKEADKIAYKLTDKYAIEISINDEVGQTIQLDDKLL